MTEEHEIVSIGTPLETVRDILTIFSKPLMWFNYRLPTTRPDTRGRTCRDFSTPCRSCVTAQIIHLDACAPPRSSWPAS